MNSKARIGVHLSAYHLYSAQLFARRAMQMEDDARHATIYERLDSKKTYQRISFSMGTVFSCVAFLEASINELFSECANNYWPSIASAGLREDERRILAKVWTCDSERLPILDKYHLAIGQLGRLRLPMGKKPLSDVTLLILLRNFLTHFDGRMMSYRDLGEPPLPQKEQALIERRLRGKFRPSELSHPTSAFFPFQCLGGYCAKWAFDSSLEFAKAFSRRLEIADRYPGWSDQWFV